jgi:hypothetical protein
MLMIQCRTLIEVNTDPQRRCYNGVHAKSELVWTAWADLDDASPDRVEARLTFWRELNDYAVSQRGKAGTLKEFRVDPLRVPAP